ncbi:MAG: hypothetical protein GY809_28795 [Planctomycetes bacterium]|nr:hypothetical protein [Planctomycetota bacterium]
MARESSICGTALTYRGRKCYEQSESVALLEVNGLMVYSREHPKVVLLFDTSRGPTREILRGIVRYAHLHGP